MATDPNTLPASDEYRALWLEKEEALLRAEELDEILGDLLRDHSEREVIGGGPNWRERHAETWRRAWEIYGEERGI